MHTSSRRTVLTAAGTVPLATALAACGGSGDGDDGRDAGQGSGGGAPGEGGAVLAPAADIPEGGGRIFEDEKVVVTQPAAGEYKAYSAVCTHAGCLVSKVTRDSITCACHNSTYALEDGSVTGGPARKPLPEVGITVEGGEIRLS
jgi:nitrite reductase/ring-hydroxylating ferredoxin subunit